jgi:cytochrome bd ubiquinol oxidase subunit II
MSLAYILLAILWLALIIYTVLGGADFGAGMLELFAVGPTGIRQEALIDESIDPVWEANHVWLIVLLVILFSAFPSAFAAINIILFIPLVLAVIGIVLRGSAFAFRVHGIITRQRTVNLLGRIFSAASIITPFFLAVCAAAIASGHIIIVGNNPQTNLGSEWVTPFTLTIGAMALSLCVTIAAIYMTVEASARGDSELAEAFRQRGLIAGALVAVFGVLGLLQAPSEAPVLWHGMLDHALILIIATMLIGVGAALALWTRRYQLARILIIGETAFLLGTWGVSQLPYLIPPDVTVTSAASSQSTMLTLLVGLIIALIIVIPSFWLLFYVFKFKKVTDLAAGD